MLDQGFRFSGHEAVLGGRTLLPVASRELKYPGFNRDAHMVGGSSARGSLARAGARVQVHSQGLQRKQKRSHRQQRQHTWYSRYYVDAKAM